MDDLFLALQNHLENCEEAHRLAMEENRLLTQTAQPPDDAFLSAKQNILTRLGESLDAVRGKRVSDSKQLTKQHRQLMEKAQQIVLKTLLLDRENEQLLFKNASGAKRPAAQVMTPLNQIQRLYERHAKLGRKA